MPGTSGSERSAGRAHRLATSVLGWAASVFTRIEVVGGPIPEGPVLVTANHLNALLDPLILFRVAGRPTCPLAKAPLFDQRIVGGILRCLGGLPVYRRQDDPAQMSRNADTFRGAVDALHRGAAMSLPTYPGHPDTRSLFFYFLNFALGVATFAFLRWLYGRRFVLTMNAIRDDESKAEAMGLHTKRIKTVAWAISAFFLGISGAIFGNMSGFIEPLEIAFPTITFGIFMVLMVLLGGKGTIWGPVIGAVVFHVIKELTWTYLEGWQYIMLGALIVIIVVYFQQGIVGWMMDRWPERFGIVVDRSLSAKSAEKGAAE